MRFTVVWTDSALAELAAIWLNAKDREAVRKASDRIDAELRIHPNRMGRAHPRGRRTVIIRPLAVTFKVDEQDCKVVVTWVSIVDASANGKP
jgi:hypothetical protein